MLKKKRDGKTSQNWIRNGIHKSMRCLYLAALTVFALLTCTLKLKLLMDQRGVTGI